MLSQSLSSSNTLWLIFIQNYDWWLWVISSSVPAHHVHRSVLCLMPCTAHVLGHWMGREEPVSEGTWAVLAGGGLQSEPHTPFHSGHPSSVPRPCSPGGPPYFNKARTPHSRNNLPEWMTCWFVCLFLFNTFSQGWGGSDELFSFMFTFLINKIDWRANLYLWYWTLCIIYIP